jgi:hypothetical protein
MVSPCARSQTAGRIWYGYEECLLHFQFRPKLYTCSGNAEEELQNDDSEV